MSEKEPDRRRAYVRAVPWKTPTEEKVKWALGEVPAYIRRLSRLERSLEDLYAGAEAAREELLGWVALRVRQLEPWPEELPAGARSSVEEIRGSIRDLPAYRKLRHGRPSRSKKGQADRSLEMLRASVRRFNAAFLRWLDEEAPIIDVNSQIDGYNRHFQFERQCAVRHVPLGKLRFERMEPISREEILARYPLLPVP